MDEPLHFKKPVRDRKGKSYVVDLDYEKVSKLCFSCHRLTHDAYHCRQKLSKGDGNGFQGEENRFDPKIQGVKGGILAKKSGRASRGEPSEEGGLQRPECHIQGESSKQTSSKLEGKRVATGGGIEEKGKRVAEDPHSSGSPIFYKQGKRERKKTKVVPTRKEVRKRKSLELSEHDDKVGKSNCRQRIAAESERQRVQESSGGFKEPKRTPTTENLDPLLGLDPSDLRFQIGSSDHDSLLSRDGRKRRPSALKRLSGENKRRRVQDTEGGENRSSKPHSEASSNSPSVSLSSGKIVQGVSGLGVSVFERLSEKQSTSGSQGMIPPVTPIVSRLVESRKPPASI